LQIITVNIDKGGTGKSTVTYNFADWLTKQDYEVLVIDGDRSCNLTDSYQSTNNSTIADIFEKNSDQQIEVENITPYLDLIKGSEKMKDHVLDLHLRQNNCLIFFMWIADNYKWLDSYDYIIIDTHNDESLVTKNFLAVADIILGVSDPSNNGFKSWLKLNDTMNQLKEELINPIHRNSYVTGSALLIANRVDVKTTTSNQFLEVIETDERYLGMIQEKQLMAKSLLNNQPIFEQRKEMSNTEINRHENFYDSIDVLFNKIIAKINEYSD